MLRISYGGGKKRRKGIRLGQQNPWDFFLWLWLLCLSFLQSLIPLTPPSSSLKILQKDSDWSSLGQVSSYGPISHGINRQSPQRRQYHRKGNGEPATQLASYQPTALAWNSSHTLVGAPPTSLRPYLWLLPAADTCLKLGSSALPIYTTGQQR